MSWGGFMNEPDDLAPVPQSLNKPGLTVTHPDQFAAAAYKLAVRNTDPHLIDQEN